MYPLGYYSHNLHFVAYSRMMQARYRDARTWAAQLRRHVASHIDAMPMITAYGAYEWLVLEKPSAEKDLFLRASDH
ncbi:MAG: hypothetical protein ACK6DY_24285 [Acidobacteriota bacterium]|jgi:hypothetical protein